LENVTIWNTLEITQSPRVNEITSEYPAVEVRAPKFDVCRRKKNTF